MGEEWRAVAGYEGIYEVSSEGRVRSLPRTVRSKGGASQHRPGRVLVAHPQSNGYLIVTLANEGTKKTRSVHRLVCEAFHGPSVDMDAAHKNGNKLDNRASNMYWATRSRNILDQIDHGTHQYGSRDRCNSGHIYTPETVRYYPSYNGRYCGVCLASRNKRKKA